MCFIAINSSPCTLYTLQQPEILCSRYSFSDKENKKKKIQGTIRASRAILAAKQNSVRGWYPCVNCSNDEDR